MKDIARHQCLVYEGSPAAHLPSLVSVIRHKLKENNRCLYLNSPSMVAGLGSYLFAAGVDVSQEVMNGSLILSSDQGHLESGRFDIDRMLQMLAHEVDRALNAGYQGLWATGDMSWEFGPEKDFSKLLEYEWRLEAFFQKCPTISGICQYHMDILPADTVGQGLSTHPAIFINETLSRLNPRYVQPGSVIASEKTMQV